MPGAMRRLVETKEIVLCCGPGGVGKTTVAASTAVLAASVTSGRVLVLTIDPARRLAEALGLQGIGNDVVRVDAATLRAAGIEPRGELHCAMLDMKRSWDDLIARHAPDGVTARRILGNPLYQNITSRFVQSHDYIAMERLHELHSTGEWDLIVVDTPPTRNALDFLDAPGRLLGFLEGRALQVFLGPSGLTARMFGRGTALVFAIFARVTGVDMLSELSRFFRSLTGVIGAFGERTRSVEGLLREATTSFVIVTSPEPEPAREARFLAERLAAAQMPVGALIVNRVHTDGLHGFSAAEVAELLGAELGGRLAARVAANLADFDGLAQRDRETIAQLSRRQGAGPLPAPVLVPHLDEDVQDLLGLSRVAEHLLH